MGFIDRMKHRPGCALFVYGTAAVVLTAVALVVLFSAFASIRACRWITGEERGANQAIQDEPTTTTTDHETPSPEPAMDDVGERVPGGGGAGTGGDGGASGGRGNLGNLGGTPTRDTTKTGAEEDEDDEDEGGVGETFEREGFEEITPTEELLDDSP